MSVKSIMKSFDFEKVYRYMVDRDWKWAMGDGQSRVPTLKEVKKEAKALLKEVKNDPDMDALSTCGFVIEKIKGIEGDYLKLSFVIADASDEGE